MSVVLKVQERGQVTLPKRLREEMGLQAGDSVVVIPNGNGSYVLERLEPLSFSEMVERWGIKTPTNADDVERMIQEGLEAEADEFIRKFRNE